ncbi:MAG: hypothetical protein JWO11_3922 [Nocardioides sp.]|nr:hypothetical protein [Nocardioides sp.]
MKKVGDIVGMGAYGAQGRVTEVRGGLQPFTLVEVLDDKSRDLLAMEERFGESLAEIAYDVARREGGVVLEASHG